MQQELDDVRMILGRVAHKVKRGPLQGVCLVDVEGCVVGEEFAVLAAGLVGLQEVLGVGELQQEPHHVVVTPGRSQVDRLHEVHVWHVDKTRHLLQKLNKPNIDIRFIQFCSIVYVVHLSLNYY